jgi:hypothetical protein
MIYITVQDGVVEVYSDTEQEVTIIDIDLDSENDPVLIVGKTTHPTENIFQDMKNDINVSFQDMRNLILNADLDSYEPIPIHLKNLLDLDQ